MVSITIAVVPVNVKEFRPIIADFPVSETVIKRAYESDDMSIFCSARKFFNISDDVPCVYGVFCDKEIRGIPDQGISFEEFVLLMENRWNHCRKRTLSNMLGISFT